ncbi:hypothetical protein [Ralstonia wenshanensis]|uniref:Uncharacterized protein n=1 Tax=Ralstonia wenshanensis TaxID=2842456 RepID=A0AAD2B1U6_9RALS|nr:hypothetical protein [Ralstonia wenshanensis]CAJ0693060.1 hypothetical protein LMG18091_01717 [Ralstonia wenshanensis]
MEPLAPSHARVDHRRGRISLQHLDEGLQRRLRSGIGALVGRSLYQWDEVLPGQADVVVLAPGSADAVAVAPIKIWLDETPQSSHGDDAFHLPLGFSLPDLWVTLDRIALRLMDKPARPSTAPVESLPTQTTEASPEPTYRLLRWVTLEMHLQALRFRRAMATMTNRAVSLRWLTTDGGLEQEEARLLLRTLNRLGALQIDVHRDAPVATTPANAGVSHSRFFDVVGRWLQTSRHQLQGRH